MSPVDANKILYNHDNYNAWWQHTRLFLTTKRVLHVVTTHHDIREPTGPPPPSIITSGTDSEVVSTTNAPSVETTEYLLALANATTLRYMLESLGPDAVWLGMGATNAHDLHQAI